MKLLLKLIIFLVLPLMVQAGEIDNNELIKYKIIDRYNLDESVYEIDILNNSIETKEFTPEQLVIKPLSQKDPLGLFTVIAEIYKDNVQVERAQVKMRIRKFGEVLVINGKLKRNDLITKDNVTVERKEITTLFERPVEAIDQIAAYRLKRNVKTGQILTYEALEIIPDLEQGMETTIVYNDGLCRITAPGLTLQSGSAGDMIKVKNKSTNKIIVARVVDGSSVSVGP